MIDALIAGKLYRAPEKRTSKSGNEFVTGKIRAAPGPDGVPTFVNFIAFRDHICAALMELADGSSIAIAGELKVGTYQAKDGTTKASLDINVHELLTPYHVSRRRQAVKDGATDSEPARNQPSPAKTTAAPGQGEDFNDEIPF